MYGASFLAISVGMERSEIRIIMHKDISVDTLLVTTRLILPN